MARSEKVGGLIYDAVLALGYILPTIDAGILLVSILHVISPNRGSSAEGQALIVAFAMAASVWAEYWSCYRVRSCLCS